MVYFIPDVPQTSTLEDNDDTDETVPHMTVESSAVHTHIVPASSSESTRGNTVLAKDNYNKDNIIRQSSVLDSTSLAQNSVTSKPVAQPIQSAKSDVQETTSSSADVLNAVAATLHDSDTKLSASASEQGNTSNVVHRHHSSSELFVDQQHNKKMAESQTITETDRNMAMSQTQAEVSREVTEVSREVTEGRLPTESNKELGVRRSQTESVIRLRKQLEQRGEVAVRTAGLAIARQNSAACSIV